jgi:hypothetical protein
MSIRSQAERKKLEAIGKIVRLTLDEMSAAVRPGVTTAELDTVAAMVLAREAAESSPMQDARKAILFPSRDRKGVGAFSVFSQTHNGTRYSTLIRIFRVSIFIPVGVTWS